MPHLMFVFVVEHNARSCGWADVHRFWDDDNNTLPKKLRTFSNLNRLFETSSLLRLDSYVYLQVNLSHAYSTWSDNYRMIHVLLCYKNILLNPVSCNSDARRTVSRSYRRLERYLWPAVKCHLLNLHFAQSHAARDSDWNLTRFLTTQSVTPHLKPTRRRKHHLSYISPWVVHLSVFRSINHFSFF